MGARGPYFLTVRVYLPLAMMVLVFGLYAGALNHPFMIDDHAAIVDHPDVTKSEGLWQLWTRAYQMAQRHEPGFYRPITILSYHLNARVTGFEPDATAFRVVNVALLGLTGWLVALWLSQWTYRGSAWLAAFVFVAHPSNAEAVNLLTGRADLLALLGIVGFLWQQRAAQQAGHWGGWRIAAAVLLAVVALGSKETGLVLLPAALVQAWVGRFTGVGPAGPRRPPNEPAPATVRPAVRWAAVALLCVPMAGYLAARTMSVGWVLTFSQSNMDISLNPLRIAEPAVRLPAAMSVAWFYLVQIVKPDTCFNHIPARLPDWSSLSALLGATALIVALVLLVWMLRRRRFLAIALTIAVAQYLIVGNLVVPSAVYASNRLTLPFTLAGAMALAALIDRFTAGILRRLAMAAIPCSLLVVAMAGMVITQINPCWARQLARAEADWLEEPGNPVAQYHYGVALFGAGRYSDAVTRLEEAVEEWRAAGSHPRATVQARHRLALAYRMVGRPESAAEQWQKILELTESKDLRAHLWLAQMALDRRDFAAAEEHIRAAAALAEADPEVRELRKRLKEEK